MPKKTGLGRGLGSLLGDEAVAAANQAVTGEPPPDAERLPTVKNLKISDIAPNPNQPRKVFDQAALETLAASIRKYGVLQPISVRWSPKERVFIIIAGERRWRAARMAGLEKMPAVTTSFNEQSAYELSLIENLMREDLNPIEEALGYRTLMQQYGLSEAEVGERVGRDRTTIANSIRLLSLSTQMLEWLESGRLTPGHARPLVTLPPAMQDYIGDIMVRDALSVRQAEQLVKKTLKRAENDPNKLAEDAMDARSRKTTVNYTRELARVVERQAGRRCKINITEKKSGWMSLQFFNLDDLERLIRVLTPESLAENKENEESEW